MTRYRCPFCIYSIWDKNEEDEGKALQNIENHVSNFHDRSDALDKIEIIIEVIRGI